MGQELGHVLAAPAAALPTGNATVTALGVLEPREVDQGLAVGAGGPPLLPVSCGLKALTVVPRAP